MKTILILAMIVGFNLSAQARHLCMQPVRTIAKCKLGSEGGDTYWALLQTAPGCHGTIAYTAWCNSKGTDCHKSEKNYLGGVHNRSQLKAYCRDNKQF